MFISLFSRTVSQTKSLAGGPGDRNLASPELWLTQKSQSNAVVTYYAHCDDVIQTTHLLCMIWGRERVLFVLL